MNHTFGAILQAHLLDEDQKHRPNFMAITEMAINSTINTRVKKAPFEIFYGKSIPFPIDLLFSRELSIDLQADSFTSKIKKN